MRGRPARQGMARIDATVNESALTHLVAPVSLIVVDRTSRSADVVAVLPSLDSVQVLEPCFHPTVASLALSVRDASGRTVDVTRESVEELLGGSVSHAVMFSRLRGPRTVDRAA